MYKRANLFLGSKSKILESVHGKKMSGSSYIKNDKLGSIYVYIHFICTLTTNIQFYCKNNFFQ